MSFFAQKFVAALFIVRPFKQRELYFCRKFSEIFTISGLLGSWEVIFYISWNKQIQTEEKNEKRFIFIL